MAGRTPQEYQIVFSPDGCWGHESVFGHRDLFWMLEWGCLTPGTIIEAGGERMRVIGASGPEPGVRPKQPQELVPAAQIVMEGMLCISR